jgi:hypothetical protein
MTNVNINKKDLNILEIEWIDAVSDDNSWQDVTELQKQKLRPVTSVGYLLKEDSKSTIIVSSFDEESQCGGGGVVIPTNCIIKKTILKGQIDVE